MITVSPGEPVASVGKSDSGDSSSLILASLAQQILTNHLVFIVAMFQVLHDVATLVPGVGDKRIFQFLVEFRLLLDVDFDYSGLHRNVDQDRQCYL